MDTQGGQKWNMIEDSFLMIMVQLYNNQK